MDGIEAFASRHTLKDSEEVMRGKRTVLVLAIMLVFTTAAAAQTTVVYDRDGIRMRYTLTDMGSEMLESGLPGETHSHKKFRVEAEITNNSGKAAAITGQVLFVHGVEIHIDLSRDFGMGNDVQFVRRRIDSGGRYVGQGIFFLSEGVNRPPSPSWSIDYDFLN